jgi:hypothetical protein
MFSELTCKKCKRKKAYELVEEEASEDLDRTGYHKKFIEKWKCKYCGNLDIIEGEDHEDCYED